MAKPIYNITPFSLLDYPDKISCILWFAGCNMRCGYCYNPEIVTGQGRISIEEVKQFLSSRIGLLDAVVFSGGECTSHKSIFEFAGMAKDMGLSVKIDTNGSHPAVIKRLIDEKLVDYIALDFKALPSQFLKITGKNLFQPFEKTLAILMDEQVEYEVRTTVHSDLISDEELDMMVWYLYEKGYRSKNYYLQSFVNGAETIEKLGYSTPCRFEIGNAPADFPLIVFR
jgi:pyruvate formate lyase activating enzyme